MDYWSLLETFVADKNKKNNDKISTVLNSLRALFISYQKNGVTNYDYLKEIQAWVSILEDLDVNILENILCHLTDEIEDMFSEDQENKVKKSLERKTLGQLLFIGADRNQYNNMKSNIKLNMAMGTNNYPDLLRNNEYTSGGKEV